MKITIKNLQQQTFCIDIESKYNVKELKQAIYVDRGAEYAVERQKLIYAGVILDDERTIASYNIDEKKFIVVMLKRDVGSAATVASLTPVATASNKNNSQKEETADDNVSARVSKTESDANELAAEITTTTTVSCGDSTATPANANTISTSSSTTATTTSSTDSTNITQAQPHLAESNLLMGEEYQRSVTSMIEMGYSRELVERAMAASFNNPERAVEYLISGIPENSDLGFISPAAAMDDAATAANIIDTNDMTLRSTGGAQREDPFEFLRNQPQFLQMRSLVYQNPDLLQAVLRQIGQTNPALLQLISENQDAFLHMLNQPLEAGESVAPDSVGSGATTTETNRRAQLEAVTRAVAGGAALTSTVRDGIRQTDAATGHDTSPARRDITTASGGNQTVVLGLTSTDKQAIERLKAMGFPEALVLQAYFACEKDEQLAANFLISSAFDD